MVDPAALALRFRAIRKHTKHTKHTKRICAPLQIEDHVPQSMSLASPAKWHLAHTTWFFERFVLAAFEGKNFKPFDEHFEFLFNSYYDAVGARTPQADRGMLTRPSVAEIYQYRESIERRIVSLLERCSHPQIGLIAQVLELGLQHEQQHRELLVSDFKHIFSFHPFATTYDASLRQKAKNPTRLEWIPLQEGLQEIGAAADVDRFVYDNEIPRQRVFLEPFRLASRPSTNGEYLQFVEDGGYQRPELWLSLGWQAVQPEMWQHPIYWHGPNGDQDWQEFTLAGLIDLNPHAPVCHLSYFEADAFARWSAARLPSEAEWKVMAAKQEPELEDKPLMPEWTAEDRPGKLHSMFRCVWRWTRSSYDAYPGYKPLSGALGEYNGKFMCNQYVLRGGSCATPGKHIRASYRNFFPPQARWQFSGVRLAKDGLA